MGSLRTLLALAVVLAHCQVTALVGGRLAVQLFYVISGFLISHILVEARTYRSARSFYGNRFLRLFPLYWTVAAIALAMNLAQFLLTGENPWIATLAALDPAGLGALLAANLLLFGQDWIMFTAVHDGVLHLAANFRHSDVEVWRGLLVPQAWTLGVELTFYLLAPLILPRRRLVIALLLASLALRAALVVVGVGTTDPWTYRFFPTELALFLAGALSQQWLTPLYARLSERRARQAGSAAAAGMALYVLVFALLPMRALHTVLLLGLTVAVLPLLFRFQSNHRWDRRVGELSYPIYICHLAVIFPVDLLFRHPALAGHDLARVLLVVAATLAAAHLLNVTIGRRVERLRDRVRDRAT